MFKLNVSNLFLYLYISLLLFSCASVKPAYIGEWKKRPDINRWANLKHQLYLDFPDDDWRVFTYPSDSLKEFYIKWPTPSQLNGVSSMYRILISIGFKCSIQDLSIRYVTSNTKVPVGFSNAKNRSFFLRNKEEQSKFYLSIIDVPEKTDLEEFVMYFADTYNKLTQNETWRQEQNLEHFNFEEIEKKSVVSNDRNYIQIRYRIKNLKFKNEPIVNSIGIFFKLNNKILLADFIFREGDYNFMIEKSYQIVNSIKQISSEQEYNKLVEFNCGENELQLRAVYTSDYSEAVIVKKMLSDGKEFSKVINNRPQITNMDIGCINSDDLMPEMRKTVQQLDVNQISDIVNIHSTYYIIKRTK